MKNFSTERRQILLAGAGLALQAGLSSAHAQEIVKILVGFPAGGALDTTARVYAEFTKGLGTLVTENHPGAAGNIAAAALAQSRPDGNTMMFAPVNVYCISQSLYRNLAFDANRDFAPLGIVASFPWALAVNPSVPVANLAELIAWAKANPDKANCGMASTGSEGHLMAYAFSRDAGVPLSFVAYKGGAPMAQDLMAGHIPMAFDAIPNLVQPHNAGKMRVLAVTSSERTPSLPAVPTFRELKHPGAVGESWIGVATRAGTPAPRIRAIASAFGAAAQSAEVRSKLALLGLATRNEGPEQMAAAMTVDTARYAALVKALGLRLD